MKFKDYHDIYMQAVVMLLCDVFEEFSSMYYKSFGLDPKKYHTAPGFAWDAVLLHSGAKLQPLVDEDMYIFFEKAIRGGYANIHKNYWKANHKYLPDYDPNLIAKFLIDWDFNSMYATAMLKAMPSSDFRWGTSREIKSLEDLIKNREDEKIPPCTISVDLQNNPINYEREKIFAICPDIFVENGVKKLTHTLYDKKDYVVHHRIL